MKNSLYLIVNPCYSDIFESLKNRDKVENFKTNILCLSCNRKVGAFASEISDSIFCSCQVINLLDVQNLGGVNREYIDLYRKFAEADLSYSFQDENHLDKKSIKDASFLKEFLTSSSKVLEIGPGKGDLARILSPVVDQYFVSDIVSTYFTSQTFPGSTTKVLMSIEDSQIYDFFDVIIAIDVFEHILNEGDGILNCVQMLKENGLLFIKTPNCEPLISYAKKLGAPFPFVHLRTYSKRSLKFLVNQGGLKVQKVRYVDTIFGKGFPRSFGENHRIAISRKWRSKFKEVWANRDGDFFEEKKSKKLARKIYGYLPKIVKLISIRLLFKPLEVYVIARKSKQ